MATVQFGFQPLDLRNATESEYACLSKFKNILNREYDPDDPPIPLEEHIQGWKNIPNFVEHEVYIVWNSANTEIIAYCEIAVYNTGDNEHLADFTIEVVPEYRNRGIARQALKLLLPFVKKHQRTLLFSFTSDRIPVSEILFEYLGARKGLGMQMYQLKLSEFDKILVQKWLAQSEGNHSEFEFGFVDGIYPDNIINEIAKLRTEVGNDQPRENLEMEDIKFTPEMLRQNEQSMFARGDRRWTMYLLDRTHGKIAGLTEVFWNPNRAMILN